MDGEIETKKLDKASIFTETKERCQVVGVVLGGINGGELALPKDIAVDTAGNVGKFCDAGLPISFESLGKPRRLHTGPWSPRK